MAVDQVDYAKKWTIVSLPVAQPASATDWSATVPPGQVYKLKAIAANFTASGTAGSRNCNFQILDASGNLVAAVAFATAIVAAGAAFLLAAVGGAHQTGTFKLNSRTAQVEALPELDIPEGFTIQSSTFSMQTGDQWGNIALLAEVGNAQ